MSTQEGPERGVVGGGGVAIIYIKTVFIFFRKKLIAMKAFVKINLLTPKTQFVCGKDQIAVSLHH